MKRAICLCALVAWAVCALGHEFIHPKSLLRIENLVVQLEATVQLTTNISELVEQRQPVLVEWSGVDSPGEQDMIALYVYWNRLEPRWTLPVQFISCAALDPGHLASGSGKGVFRLLNHRDTYAVAFLRGGIFKPQVAALSEPIINKIRNLPSGGHLALHEDQRSVMVQWVSGSAFNQEAQWGLADPTADSTYSTDSQYTVLRDIPGVSTLSQPRYRYTGSSTSVTYQRNQTCGYPANSTGWMWPGYIHSALIPASTLKPGKRYVYRYGSDSAGWSAEHSFIAPIGPGLSALQHAAQSDPAQPDASASKAARKSQAGSTVKADSKDTSGVFKFLAFNDVGMTNPLLFNNPGRGLSWATDYCENSTWLATRLSSGGESDAHLALMVGDLAYAIGYGADWDVFGDQFESAFTQWPMAVGTGNHERDWPHTGDAFGNTARDSGGECNVPYTYRWYTPSHVKLDPFTSYYSFSQGPVHFLILDSESPSGPDTPQGRFVAQDLASVDRSVTPWVVASMHRMMQAPATWRHPYVGDVDVMERLQGDYEQLFRQYKVDVVISGHEHAYARTCPMYQGTCVTQPLDTLTPSDDNDCTASAWACWWLRAVRKAGSLVARIAGQGKAGGDTGSGRQRPVGHNFRARAGGPVYVLAGHAGAGFTHGFPEELPEWVEHARQDINGYVRFTADGSTLNMEAVVAKDGSVMDSMTLHLSPGTAAETSSRRTQH